MNFRSTKPMDYVSMTRNLSDSIKKTHNLRLKWQRDYGWLIDKYRDLETALNELCDEYIEESKKSKTTVDQGAEDKRSCHPFPKYTNQNYGWLSSKPEFRLEKFGSMVPKFSDPMANVVLLGGDIPCLAVGKGFIL